MSFRDRYPHAVALMHKWAEEHMTYHPPTGEVRLRLFEKRIELSEADKASAALLSHIDGNELEICGQHYMLCTEVTYVDVGVVTEPVKDNSHMEGN